MWAENLCHTCTDIHNCYTVYMFELWTSMLKWLWLFDPCQRFWFPGLGSVVGPDPILRFRYCTTWPSTWRKWALHNSTRLWFRLFGCWASEWIVSVHGTQPSSHVQLCYIHYFRVHALLFSLCYILFTNVANCIHFIVLLRMIWLILSVSADEGLRGRNVLIYLTLCYVRCSTSFLFAISHIAMSIYSISMHLCLWCVYIAKC